MDENGLLDVEERVAPSAANISAISSGDYKFYTQGNGSPGGSVAATPTITVATPTTPPSHYRTLRDYNNYHTVIPYFSYHPWFPHEVKQTSDDTTMVGTDDNDEFDANYHKWIDIIDASIVAVMDTNSICMTGQVEHTPIRDNN